MGKKIGYFLGVVFGIITMLSFIMAVLALDVIFLSWLFDIPMPTRAF